MLTSFTKMHGCGNDFVIFDARQTVLALTSAQVRAIGDRRTGVGFDQLIVLAPPPPGGTAHVTMTIFNPDGSEAGACGNATRCVADLLAREAGRAAVSVRTIAGELACRIEADARITVAMGPAGLGWQEVPLARDADTLHVPLGGFDAACVSIGNPHATLFVDDPDALDRGTIGSALERDAIFPERANIGFAQVRADHTIRLRMWERGAGETRACGSGACAAMVNAARRGLLGRRRQAKVELDGGALDIVWRADGQVEMTGPALTVFTGTIDLASLAPV